MDSKNPIRRVVIFTDRFNSPTYVEHIEAIADAFPDWELTIIQEKPPRRWWRQLRTKLRRWWREPISFPLQAIEALSSRFPQPRRRHADARPVPLPGSPAAISRDNVRYTEVAGIHRKSTLRLVARMKPWLGISIGAPILKKALFGIPELGTINIHKSLLPIYRGMTPGFWELRDGVTTSGVSIHWINNGLDTGDLILQRPLAINAFSTPAGLAAELDLLGTDVLLEALARIAAGDALHTPQPLGTVAQPPEQGRTPPWLLAKKVRRTCWRRRANARWDRAAKDAILVLYVYIYCAIRNALRGAAGRCHTTVLVYHRVSDEFLDTTTVGVEQFQRHLRCLGRHCDVIDLPTFLASRGAPRRRPSVVLTFDDGYEDNLLAALLLRRAGLPCTFFISTAIVGSDGAFPHDLQRLGRRVPPLNWDQVRRMAAWGFRISNHTATHSSLAAMDEAQAIAEIETARRDLVRELGEAAAVRWLAYPYGKPENITGAVLNRLSELGIDACLTAYGGVNPPDFDPMNVLRQGVNHNYTELSLRATVEGWRWRS
jgi:peptidoglycan/xylan/chitin deacetylase (PgdA/CDA1 family)